ncbi:MAG: ABC transporter permease [Phycisphaerae bacterium]|nr:ABC transporter permease [Phycisphaerae bacterium]MDW8262227.1 ABC transporter permease [Phycisphaerales bacterium]
MTLPPEKWSLSSILVRSRSGPFGLQLMYVLNNRNEASAVNPASVMREFFNTFLKPATAAWGAVAYLVNLVAIVAILVSIYNSVAARLRDIAILRALGATRARILAVICLEAGLIGLAGGVLGLLLGHALGAAASGYLDRTIGETIRWWIVSPGELLYLLVVTLVALLAGLVPALKAYRVPVAANLVGP